MEQVVNTGASSAIDRLHARVKLLEKENKALKAERAKRPRSRSPRRFAASSSQVNVDATCKALSQVSLWQRDAVLQEHAERIAELQAELDKKKEEIVDLRRGNGPIGEVLLHNSNTDDEFTRNYWKAQTTPVRRVIESLRSISRVLDNTIFWGGASDVDIELMRPVVRIDPR